MSICGIRIIPRNLWRSEMTAHYWMFPSREGSRDLKSMQPLYKRDPGQLLHCKSLFKFIASRAAGFWARYWDTFTVSMSSDRMHRHGT